MIGIYRQAPKSVWKKHRKPLKHGAQMVPKLRKFQNWVRDLGAVFPDLAFLKLFGQKGDFWRPAGRPQKSGSARKWAKKFNTATFGSPGASPERPKRPQRASREGISEET